MFLFSIFEVNPLYVIPWVVAIVLAIGVHEFFHAWSAHKQGDDTAEREGRLTLNPLAHIDWMGLILLLVIGFGWGKPTPFNPYNLKYKKWGSALVSLAGPASNLFMALAALTLFKLFGFTNLNWFLSTNFLEVFLLFMIQLNVVLFVFNLIPIPPLDGSKILYTFLGPNRQQLIFMLERQGPILLLFFIVLGRGILSTILNTVLVGLFSLFDLL